MPSIENLEQGLFGLNNIGIEFRSGGGRVIQPGRPDKPGKDPWAPKTTVVSIHDISIDEFPPPGFDSGESTGKGVVRRTKKEVGNYNADLSTPD